MGDQTRRHSRTGLFSRSRTRRRRARRRLVVGLLLLAGLALMVLAFLARPLLRVQDEAMTARSELVAAKTALGAGDATTARKHTARARQAVRAAQEDLDSPGSRVWGVLPVAGGAVDDVEHLVDALDHTTSMAEIGVRVYPALTATQSALSDGGRIAPQKVDRLIADGREVGREAIAAQAALDLVAGDAPFLGGRLGDARDQAQDVVVPVADGYRTLEPTLDALPRALGLDKPQTYLIAVLNPAELRWSGGAPLSVTKLSLDRGRADLGRQFQLSKVVQNAGPGLTTTWEPVAGNPFHSPGEDYIGNATFNPDWPVSATEVQRAWSALTGDPEVDGVLAVDVTVLAELMKITGPADVPGYGTVTGDTLVQFLSGNYDNVRQIPRRQRLNKRLAFIFRSQLFTGGDLAAKGRVIGRSARGRHLAFWSVDPEVQGAFDHLGLTGALGDPAHDYLGVFTQNTNFSKADYYQRRELDSTVRLREDGSARVELTITIHNDTPPYSRPGFDRRIGYFTRFSSPGVLQLFPTGARLESLTLPVAGTSDAPLLSYGERPFFRRVVRMRPATTAKVKVVYDVPHAAVRDGDRLTYRLVYDPQGLVNAQSLKVTVLAPDGFEIEEVPDDWRADGDSRAVLDAPALDSRGDWSVELGS